mmetsp:Transcript_24313/g.23925  ORF Transcript_24313/g.23925 Transcript_24313/m.23925 type:complete len:201 (+) Transcript_24313:2171-2773(+)
MKKKSKLNEIDSFREEKSAEEMKLNNFKSHINQNIEVGTLGSPKKQNRKFSSKQRSIRSSRTLKASNNFEVNPNVNFTNYLKNKDPKVRKQSTMSSKEGEVNALAIPLAQEGNQEEFLARNQGEQKKLVQLGQKQLNKRQGQFREEYKETLVNFQNNMNLLSVHAQEIQKRFTVYTRDRENIMRTMQVMKDHVNYLKLNS